MPKIGAEKVGGKHFENASLDQLFVCYFFYWVEQSTSSQHRHKLSHVHGTENMDKQLQATIIKLIPFRRLLITPMNHKIFKFRMK